VRIAAVDSSVDDARVERALAAALGKAPDRLFLFGAAIDVAARIASKTLAQRDDRFLDLAASYVLDSSSTTTDQVPSRAAMRVPLIEIGVAIGREQSPLASTMRAIEMIGAHLCMAVADAAAIEPDEIDNAALWICGGSPELKIEQLKSRTLLCPGDVAAGGFVAVVDAGAAEMRIASLDADGHVVDARASAVGSGPRMQVQG
jgi:hypothetical protein